MNYIGFDTSNYTTSTAIYDGSSFISSRRLLDVKSGERGLRQSDALFQHVKRLPEVMDKLGQLPEISAVGVSTRPRNADGSYMPVFLAGISFAKTASSVLGVPLYEFSHQDGHIMAGICSCKAYELLSERFLSVHISGGTTELLLTEYNGHSFDVEIVGGTKDISAGQVIDRVGVRLGLGFPCGKELDSLYYEASNAPVLPVSCREGFFNFSGLETKTERISASAPDLAKGVIDAILETLVRAIGFCIKSFEIHRVLLVGGVASNSVLRKKLPERLDADTYFAPPEMSSDNACGIAALAACAYERGEKGHV
ncbi:MAG: DNA-binding protein [Clostridia bacterium]|nr:DNA-binding protein [Clostridia bacterium]